MKAPHRRNTYNGRPGLSVGYDKYLHERRRHGRRYTEEEVREIVREELIAILREAST